MIDYFYLFLYKCFTLLSKLLPKKVMDLLLLGLSKLIYRLDKKHRSIIQKNLSLAFGSTLTQSQKDQIGIRTFYNMLQTIISFMKRYGKTSHELLEKVSFHNEAFVQHAIDTNQKIIFMTGHYSNWELLAPAIAAKFNITLVAVGRKLDSEVMDNVLIKNREQFGVEILYRKGAMKGMIKALKKGKAVGLLLDQNLGEKQGGIKVNFFGRSVGHSPAAAVLARTLDAVVIPSFISTDDYENYTVTFYEPLPIIKTEDKEEDIRLMTQAQADITQEVIEGKPEEWFWVHKRWKTYYPELYKEHLS
ncbi:lipid A biosynthesis lauroyl acyltransferase [Sulfurovum sp. zt1-1]|uniref:Lipid A biosynthesis lauroyl acyltransferase n=1 Tax=Sulfurovum zhangzhouensis TaxID=3019067 RepID=A0ABT7QWR2_9BACT|nr:lipid A biosynthesis lauroyl acyltransferase [Sulfurovum zhangzhouensis]MDM5271268.1 lipid A biosynthesis lauroyl acyltransferase [Sulfurovum zhangzhouensis]